MSRMVQGGQRVAGSTIWKGLLWKTGLIAALAQVPAMSTAQDFRNLKTERAPLVLKAIGSFYVGGRTVEVTSRQTAILDGGPQTVDQMYVQYMIPKRAKEPAIVLVHGSTLSGKSYETTPDGRIGWYEYFARRGFPSYVVDQVARARSGFNQAPYNDVRTGIAIPASQPSLRRGANTVAWVRFRFGPAPGVKFDDTQFPVEAAEDLSKQFVPDLSQSLTVNDPNLSALAELSGDLRQVILLGHSQAGRYPFETALLNPSGLRGLIAVEPAGCKASIYSDEQIAKLARLPILVVFGDHLASPADVQPNWATYFRDCQAFVARVNAANGDAKMLHPVDLEIHGNSHMIMQDKNNLQIADLIIDWIGGHR